MFKKFNPSDLSTTNNLKSSAIRGIRGKLADQFPKLEEYLDDLLPKKEQILQGKLPDHITVVIKDGEILFFQRRDGPVCPSLHVVHKYPGCFPQLKCDKGAIKFVFSGANIMCPGITSAGGAILDEGEEGDVMIIMAEGMEHAMAVGVLTMSTKDIREVNKGMGVENVHYLNDGLWRNPHLN
mmetsp:Transcript_22843/g.58133  ORF Transcript_22843/g.58133 Transcript_22843/m.58133 type:complete len:182 (-) Transcript_22843:255-800(-)